MFDRKLINKLLIKKTHVNVQKNMEKQIRNKNHVFSIILQNLLTD